MKEVLEGRRLGFALRPVFGLIGLGLALAAVLVDLASWFAWGVRDTNAFVWAAYWLVIGAAIFGFLAFLADVAEMGDVPADERPLARIDLAVVAASTIVFAASAGVRSLDLGVAGATPAALLLGVLGVVALVTAAVIGGNLYAPREWEEIVEALPRERRSRRRAASR